MPRPIIATIHPNAIAHNIECARTASAAQGSRIWAVIKANAYGHGIERVYTGLSRADGLAMLDFEEAQRVRALGWDKPILMLEGAFEPADYLTALALDLTVVVHSFEQIAQLNSTLCSALSKPASSNTLNVYLKLNTGMNRVGFESADFNKAYAQLRALPCVHTITLMTHFANADLSHGADDALATFNRTCADVLVQHPQTERCMANSAAILHVPHSHSEWVRPGIMTYGASPFANVSAASLGLRAAMTLSSQIIAIQNLSEGDAVGYGSRFVAQNAMRIGIVACGYADGYPRHAADGTPILVDGVRTQLVGRVSMDMLMVDLTAIPSAQVGSQVELWGQRIAIDDVAQCSGTIGYELMCALSQRVPVKVVNIAE